MMYDAGEVPILREQNAGEPHDSITVYIDNRDTQLCFQLVRNYASQVAAHIAIFGIMWHHNNDTIYYPPHRIHEVRLRRLS